MNKRDKVELARIIKMLVSLGKLHVTLEQAHTLQLVNVALCTLQEKGVAHG